VTPARAEPLVEQVADRIRIWSGQNQVLAERLAELRNPPVAGVAVGHDETLARWTLEAPPSAPPPPAVDDLWEPDLVDDWMPVVEEPAGLPYSDAAQRPGSGSGPVNRSDLYRGQFDELFEVVSQPAQRKVLDPNRPLPPLSRFKVRVAPVSKPSRPTKRNYDYFEELNAALAERAKRSEVDPGGPSAP